MINYGKIRGSSRPQEIEITPTSVFIATNIQEYEKVLDDYNIHEYEYDYLCYDKDEYITVMTINNKHAIEELSEELNAAKILLGVE